jgi:hypothetical protein
MNVAIKIPAQLICNLFVTAVEGGSTYWCRSMTFTKGGKPCSYQEPDSFEVDDWSVKVKAYEDGVYEITPAKLAAAFTARPSDFFDMLEEDYDAGTADSLVQQAAFGDIVYG